VSAPNVVNDRQALHRNEDERIAFGRLMEMLPDFLNAKEREAVHAVYFERWSLLDAAAHLGLHAPTLKARVGRARRGLRAWLVRQAA
jgi:DNA-directed RNA polymerase specialized sigma24 family protein